MKNYTHLLGLRDYSILANGKSIYDTIYKIEQEKDIRISVFGGMVMDMKLRGRKLEINITLQL